MRTIIQHIGPLYGEANTGTVFGQPNGSIAIGQGKAPAPSPDPTPITPTIEEIWTITRNSIFNAGNVNYLTRVAKWSYLMGSTKASVTAQNYDSYTTTALTKISLTGTIGSSDSIMYVQIADSEDFSNILASIPQVAGTYTSYPRLTTDMEVVAGTTYYVRLALFDNAGNSLNKISNVLTFTGGEYGS